MPLLVELYGPVAADLLQVERIICSALASSHAPVNDLCAHLQKLRGKMLRPALLLLAGRACGDLQDDHLTAAAVVEIIHTASLVHDDVLDQADMRRGLSTVNSMCGNEAAVMLGDFLFSRAFILCSGLHNTAALKVIAEAASAVCEGELLQIRNKRNWNLSQQQYLSIISLKTASLIAACCRLGALLAGAPAEAAESLATFGHKLGMAFQITDDLLDLLGEESQTGKRLGKDLEQGKLTLPLIHHISNARSTRLLRIIENYNSATHLPELTRLLDETGSIDHACRLARDFSQQAIKAIEHLPETEAKQRLRDIAAFVAERNF